jgi:hypothetical protein
MFTANVTVTPTGKGSVSITHGAATEISNCTSDYTTDPTGCSKWFPYSFNDTLNATATPVAKPAPGYAFLQWNYKFGSGILYLTSYASSLPLTLASGTSSPLDLTAVFGPVINVTRPTQGTITSDTGGINCGAAVGASSCTASFPAGTSVTLTSTPNTGSIASKLCIIQGSFNCFVPNPASAPVAVMSRQFNISEPTTVTAEYSNDAGICGSADKTTVSAKPATAAELCSYGIPTTVSGSGPWSWDCNGYIAGSTPAHCSANMSVVSTPGTCGSAANTPTSTLPAANLCGSNSTLAAPVSGYGPWTWSCNSTNGGAPSTTCTAPLAAQQVYVQIPRTGQTTCYSYTIGGSPVSQAVACTDPVGIGQDGALAKGSVWPNPRFAENLIVGGNIPDGTITDTVTGLTWLKNSDCKDTSGGIAKSGSTLTWLEALTWSNNLQTGLCGLSDGSLPGEWRLPNANEMMSLIDLEHDSPALPLGHPFTVSATTGEFWTSTSVSSAPNNAWFMSMRDGYVSVRGKSNARNVWAVKGRALNLIKTGQTHCFDGTSELPACSGTSGQDGDLKSGIDMPDVSRFIANNDGTLTDNLTGLIWLKNANCMGGIDFNSSISWSNSLASGACSLTDNSSAGDWRIPNRNELLSLINFDTGVAPASNANRLNGLGFSGVPTANNAYWTSDTKKNSISAGWYIGMGDTSNLTFQNTKDSKQFALAVRDGNYLSVNIDGTGSGMVNSTTVGLNPAITCPGGTCRSHYNPNTQITLSPTSAWYSKFMGWFGCDAGVGAQNECSVTINQSTAVTAVFDEYISVGLYDTNNTLTTASSSKIQPAYDYLVTNQILNGTILTLVYDYFENLIFSSPITVSLNGGWDGAWPNPGFSGDSTVTGSLRVSNGKLTASNLKIRP